MDKGFAVDFWVRCNDPSAKIDIGFSGYSSQHWKCTQSNGYLVCTSTHPVSKSAELTPSGWKRRLIVGNELILA